VQFLYALCAPQELLEQEKARSSASAHQEVDLDDLMDVSEGIGKLMCFILPKCCSLNFF
jgi:hypothetical protein